MRELHGVNGCLKLCAVYVTDSSVNLVLEYIKGGELMKRLRQKNEPYNMKKISFLIRNILEALAEIHSRHIIHRDLKPENILLESEESDSSVRIADYGLSTFDGSKIHKFIFSRCGTPGFIAPEVISNKDESKLYDHKVDIFSAGVIFFLLLSGELPFIGQTHRQVLELNKKCNISFSLIDQNPKIPQKAKNLVRIMLEKNPLIRPRATDCLNHLFFEDLQAELNLSVQFTAYDTNKLISAEGLNRIAISASKSGVSSDNEVYWINPFWQGQTNTIQTESRLSSTYIQMNEVRKRNKSNFAPAACLDDSLHSNSTIRENRSASVESEAKMRISMNQSLHIAVLMKNKRGEEQRSPSPNSGVKFQFNDPNVLNPNNIIRIGNSGDSTPSRNSGRKLLNRSSSGGNISSESKQKPSTAVKKSKLNRYNTLDEVKDVSDDSFSLKTSSKGVSTSKYSTSNRNEQQSIQIRKKSKSLPGRRLSTSQVQAIRKESKPRATCISGNRGNQIEFGQEIEKQRKPLAPLELNIISQQSHKSNAVLAEISPVYKMKEMKFLLDLDSSMDLVRSKGTLVSGAVAAVVDPVVPREENQNSLMNSCIEADFLYSDVEENIIINSFFKEVNRNILSRINPFRRNALIL